MPLLVCLYRRTNDGGGVQSSAWQRPISIGGFGTAAVNTPQSSSQGSNTRNSVTTVSYTHLTLPTIYSV